MQEYLFQADAVTAHLPLLPGLKAARKGTPVKLPAAAHVATSEGTVLKRNIKATVMHYLVHRSFKLKCTRAGYRSQLHLIVIVDSSASMAADHQISLVKGWVTDMVQQYRHRRPVVSVVALLNGRAALLAPFTHDMLRVQDTLAQLHTGGKTNLVAGFEQVLQTMGKHHAQHDYQLYLFTDGRINAGQTDKPLEEAVTFFYTYLKKLLKHTCIIDTEKGYPRLGMSVILAKKLGCSVIYPQH